MTGKKLFLVLAAGALLILQFADCTPGMTLNSQTMHCCGSMPCTPSNRSHDCCKTMVSQTPSMIPASRVSINVPVIVAVEYSPILEIESFGLIVPLAVNAEQHPPPELYTLHLSLLI